MRLVIGQHTSRVIIAFIVGMVLLSIVREITPDEKIVYQDRVITKYKTQTKTKIKQVYPKVCIEQSISADEMGHLAQTLSGLPEEQANLITEIRVAIVSQDLKQLARSKEQLTRLSDKFDGTLDDYLDAKYQHDELQDACHKARE